MPQIPVNLSSAIETLREEGPSSEASERTRRALLSRTRPKGLPIRYAFALTTIAVLVAVLWPRESLSVPWSYAADQTAKAPALHRVELNEDGKVYEETWRQGDKRATVLYDRTGKVIFEDRSDGKRLFMYTDFPGRPRTSNPNWVRSGSIITLSQREIEESRPFFEDYVESLLTQKDVSVLEQRSVITESGPRILYRLKKARNPYILTVYADPESGRVRKIVSTGRVCNVDYPQAISQDVFRPAPRATKGVRVFDAAIEQAEAEKILKRGLGQKGDIELRLVALDASGVLWVLWTGPAPDGQASRPFKAPGKRLGRAFGPRAFTQSFALEPRSGVAPSIGKRLGGMGRELKDKAASTIDLQVPDTHGYVEFKSVPIMRIGSLDHLADVLGTRSPRR